jgi:hypothetical protein
LSYSDFFNSSGGIGDGKSEDADGPVFMCSYLLV